MYHSSFGLQREAFRMTPDPSVICLTARHREALAGLGYAIVSHKGFTVLTGDAGTGKTTLISRIVQTLSRDKVSFSIILNSVLTPTEFLEAALIDFGLQDIPTSKAQRVLQLQRFLLGEYRAGRQCVLIVDEAQNLSVEVLEELRLLSNCELPNRKLLQIVLCGQSELDDLLNQQVLRQLKQRVEVRLRITPLTDEDVKEYIRFRWEAAGGQEPPPFDEMAVAAIADYSNGIPRLVNTICDNSLMVAFGQGARAVFKKHVDEAALDLGLQRRRGVEAAPVLRTGVSAAHDKRAAGVTTDGLPSAATNPAPPPIPLPAFARQDKGADKARVRSRFSRWAARLGFAS